MNARRTAGLDEVLASLEGNSEKAISPPFICVRNQKCLRASRFLSISLKMGVDQFFFTARPNKPSPVLIATRD
jgi:hypothetical protein